MNEELIISKHKILEVLEGFSGNVSVQKLIDRTVILAKIEKTRSQVHNGEDVNWDDLNGEIDKWQ